MNLFWLTLILMIACGAMVEGCKKYFISYDRIVISSLAVILCALFGLLFTFQFSSMWLALAYLIVLASTILKFLQDSLLSKIGYNIDYYKEDCSVFAALVVFYTLFVIGMGIFSLEPGGWTVTLLCIFSGSSIYCAGELFFANYKLEKIFNNDFTYANISGLLDKLEYDKKNDKDKRRYEHFVRCVTNYKVRQEKLISLSLDGSELFFAPGYLNKICEAVSKKFLQAKRISVSEGMGFVRSYLAVNEKAINEFILNPENDIQRYTFADGDYYVSNLYRDNIAECNSCGIAEFYEDPDQTPHDYFCSTMCRETEEQCMRLADELRKENLAKYAIDAATWGSSIPGIAESWQKNVRIVSPHARGPHGFAAEEANTMIDRLTGKKAVIVGGDNAKDGADRLVNGEFIQTKYCATANQSVNAAFSEQTGNYRYLNSDGTPMQLEVPRDQYAAAVEAMKRKISEGRVPGVSDPEEARSIVRRGNITYEQAKAICKFGTIESLAFDAYRGTIVGLSAGGISFIISTAIVYWKTRDIKLALKSSVMVGVQAGGKAFAAFIITSQVQRIPAVNAFLDSVINFNFGSGKLAHRFGEGLYKLGGSTGNFNKTANATLKSASTAAAAMLVVVSSIEVSKMVCSRISGMQCVKNIAVSAGGISAGVLGAVVGGAFIPVVGSVIGGVIGGTIGSCISKKVMDNFIEDDSVAMLKLVTLHFEHLSREFCFGADEIALVTEELNAYLMSRKSWVEDIFSHTDCRRQYINSFMKPLFVRVCIQRQPVTFNDLSEENIVSALAG